MKTLKAMKVYLFYEGEKIPIKNGRFRQIVMAFSENMNLKSQFILKN